MSEKIKVLVISDHPMAPSGVGTQTKYMINALLETGRYKFICFGGAIKHPDYSPQKVEGFGDDFIIQPVDGYGLGRPPYFVIGFIGPVNHILNMSFLSIPMNLANTLIAGTVEFSS